MVPGPADVCHERPDHQLVDQVAPSPGTAEVGQVTNKPEVHMTRSSSVDGGVFRGTCGYPLCKEDKNLL